MKYRRAISLILAGQIIAAPAAQAASLSLKYGSGEDLLTGISPARNILRTVQRAEVGESVTAPAPTLPPITLSTPPVEMTPVPTESPEITHVPDMPSVTTPVPTASPVATSAPVPTPVATPVPEPTPELTTAPDVVETTTPTPTATPESTLSPIVSPLPTETEQPTPLPDVDETTPVPTQSPSAEPEVTPSMSPAPEEGAEPSPGETPPAETSLPIPGEGEGATDLDSVMDEIFLLESNEILEPQLEEEIYPQEVYIGFGYEEYRADQPLLDDGIKQASNTTARFAVEKTDNDYRARSGNIADSFEGMFDGTATMYWQPRDDRYYASDLQVYDYGLSDNQERLLSLDDYKEYLGRIPDYQFENWYLSASGPMNANDSENSPYLIEDPDNGYGNAKFEIGMHNYEIFLVPLYYTDLVFKDGTTRSDLLLDTSEDSTGLDQETVADTIVDTAEERDRYRILTNEVDNTAATKHYTFYYGMEQSTYKFSDAIPIIARWKLSDNAKLVTTAQARTAIKDKDGNVIDVKETEEKTSIYAVKNKVVQTDDLLDQLYDKPLDDDSKQKVKLETSVNSEKNKFTYYLRVNSDVNAIDPTLLAWEPYYSDEIGEGGDKVDREDSVAIRVRQAGSTKYDTIKINPHEVLNAPQTNGENLDLYNSVNYPMRSKWTTTTNIDLNVAQPVGDTNSLDEEAIAAKKLNCYYNEVEITVTAPDGETKTVYTFYIQRLNNPQMTQNSGNTPFGLIAGDKRVDTDFNKDEARSHFVKGYQLDNGMWVRSLADPKLTSLPLTAPQVGVNYEYKYAYQFSRGENGAQAQPGAWYDSSYNVDLDENAIIVYQDSAFVDPGFTIKDSLGETVMITGDTTVQRSIVFRTSQFDTGISTSELRGVIPAVDESGTETGKFRLDEQWKYFTGAQSVGDTDAPKDMADVKADTFLPVQTVGGKDVIDLRGLQIIPGIYQIQYQFTDPLSGLVCNAAHADNFVGEQAETLAKAFTRTLVVLPMPGDVDMDGAVTEADAEVLSRALRDRNGSIASAEISDILFLTRDYAGPIQSLFMYRVCDVNNDGVVDDKDVTHLRNDFDPQMVPNVVKYPYVPLESQVTSEHERQSLSGQNPDYKEPPYQKGILTLDYLGKNTDEISNDPAKLDGLSTKDSLQVGDVFWVGVRVSGLNGLPAPKEGDADQSAKAAILGNIQSMMISIAYDNRYLKPASLVAVSSGDLDKDWRDTIQRYNFSESTSVVNQYRWPQGFSVVAEGSQRESDYSKMGNVHPSKAILEAEVGDKKWPVSVGGAQMPGIRQLSVALHTEGASTGRVLYGKGSDIEGSEGDQYLLRIPFELTLLPQDAETLYGLDLALGMKEFNVLSNLVPQDTQRPQTTAAWSSDTAGIYGGTWNLADELYYDYENSTARSLPLGEDNQERIVLSNSLNDGKTVYGDTYERYERNLQGLTKADADKQIRLPKGLTLEMNAAGRSTGFIKGTPEEVGTFNFQVDGGTTWLYSIIVEKAPLTIAAVPQSIYYGESNAKLDYVYKTDDIKSLDHSIAGFDYKAGTSEELAKLSGYAAPNLSTKYTKGSDAGKYAITLSAEISGEGEETVIVSGLPNYRFVYASATMDSTGKVVIGQGEEKATSVDSTLEVKKRPLMIEKVNDPAMASVSIFVNDPQEYFPDLVATYTNADANKDFDLVDLSTATGYQSLLSGTPIYDKDTVGITFVATFNDENRKDAPPYYDIPEGKNSRKIDALISNVKMNEDSSKNYELLGIKNNQAQGTVRAYNVTDIGQVVFPANMEKLTYTFGEKLSFDLIDVIFRYSDDTAHHTQYRNPTSFDYDGIVVTFVTEEELKKGEAKRDDPSRVLKHGDTMVHSVHHGMYLCFSVIAYEFDETTSTSKPKVLTWPKWDDSWDNGDGTTGAWVKWVKEGDKAGQWVTDEAPKPLTVLKKPIVLNVATDVNSSTSTIYYGEYYDMGDGTTNPQGFHPDFTYELVSPEGGAYGLAAEDAAAILQAWNAKYPDRPKTSLEGTSEELALLDGYKPPKIWATTNPEKPDDTDAWVVQKTPVGEYYVFLDDEEGTGATNYTFYYRGTAAKESDGKNPGTGAHYVRALKIIPRPIVVSSLTMQQVVGKDTIVDTDLSDAFLYDDTRVLTLEGMRYINSESGEMETKYVTANGINIGSADAGKSDTFVAKIPTGNDGNSYVDADKLNTFTKLAGTLTNSAIVEGDEVVLRYVATYTNEVPSASPPSSTHFPMNVGPGNSIVTQKVVRAQIGSLSLPANEGDNNNYVIVYDSNATASMRQPTTSSAQGLVKLRPISSLEVTQAPGKIEYVYGQALSLDGMQLKLTYQPEGDNALNGENSGVITRSIGSRDFAGQGLELYWIVQDDPRLHDGTQLTPALIQTLLATGILRPIDDNSSYPDVAKSGKDILVCGRRYSGSDADQTGHVIVQGVLDWTELLQDGRDFVVTPKPIALAVEPKYRYYGEPNATALDPFRAYFLNTSLASPDQKRLAAAGVSPDVDGRFYVTADALDPAESTAVQDVSTSINSGALNVINQPFSGTPTAKAGLVFITDGVQGADVGRYTIDMVSTGDGDLKNYTFRVTPSTVQVFRRPIVIKEILQDPVSTIFYNTAETAFPASVKQTGNTATAKMGFSTKLPATDNGRYSNIANNLKKANTDGDPALIALAANGVRTDLTLTGDAIYGNDTLELSIRVVFPAVGQRETFDLEYKNKVQRPQSVTIENMVLANGAEEKNYFLVYDLGTQDRVTKSPVIHGAMGQLDRRPITNVVVVSAPKDMMEYTYGDALNLSRLQVKVTYEQLKDVPESAGGDEILNYNMLGGRLSVNYYPESSLPAYDLESTEGQEAIQKLVSTYPAANGDHLTIAPSHEARFKDEKGNGISHNGMYLALTVRADDSMKYSAQPVLVGTAATGPMSLKVSPLDLTYELKAEDKTYADPYYISRDTTAGTITLTNPYTATIGGDVDRDLIYVSTDVANTDYKDQKALSAHMNDSDKTTSEVYTFASNGHTDKDEDGNSLAQFYFYDENVKYYDDVYTEENFISAKDWADYWQKEEPKEAESSGQWDSWGTVAPMPVLVKGLRLGGPDAANYTLDNWIGSNGKDESHGPADVAANEASLKGDPNPMKATPAYAKIEKAPQFITSTEKPLLSVDSHSNAVKVDYGTVLPVDDDDYFAPEAHYEYGLVYLVDPDTGIVSLDPSSGALMQWGGEDNWSDLPYYGGEKYTVTLPGDYTPDGNDQDKTDTEEKYDKGQNYRWAQDEAANWSAENYNAYRFGERTPLVRDAVYWGMVRLAETHNYLPSAYVMAADTDLLALQVSKAQSDAAEMSRMVEEWVTTKPTESTNTDPLLGPAEAVKTYKQSFEIRSTEEKNGTDGEKYDIDTLEAVWFTDIQTYEKRENLDAVLRNQVSTRYHSYYWDRGHSAQVEFDKNGSEGLDLTGPLTVTVKTEGEGSSATEGERQVNVGNHAVLYAATRSSGGSTTYPDGIEITTPGGAVGGGESSGNEDNTFILGSEPVQLEIKIKPSYALSEGLEWTSSDPRVATVNEKGVLVFRGVGTTTITVRTKISGRTASITITVTDPTGLAQGIGAGWEAALKLANEESNNFNFYYTEPFFALDEDYQFHPGWLMDRAEVVSVLEKFYMEIVEQATGKQPFPDLTGEESYAPAANRLTWGGIIMGLPEGIFGGERVATRAEAATILCRMMGLEPVERPLGKQSFRDLESEVVVVLEPETEGEEPQIETYTRIHWASGYINALAEAGVTLGTGEGYFNPDRSITRAELAAMLGRVLLTGVYYGGDEIVPTDVDTTHWAHDLIIRSVNNVKARTK